MSFSSNPNRFSSRRKFNEVDGMKEGIVLDIETETAASSRLNEYKDRFERAKMDEYEG